MPWLAWVAVACLLAATTSAFMVAWPRDKWIWTNKPRLLAGDEWAGRDEAEVNRLMAEFIDGHLERNEAGLLQLWSWVRAAMVFTASAVFAWVLLLSGIWS
jgi:hypothetical protein